VAKTWLQIRVDLLGSAGSDLYPAPGRILLVGPNHTFEQLADSINQSFGRWDLSHLHEFELDGGRRIGFPNDDFPVGPAWEDHAALKVAQEVSPGDEFSFTFDLGDGWKHRCRVRAAKVDLRDEYGPAPPPKHPVAIWGWGSIPDQYGRVSAEELELES
jgi:hypothetical protein